MKPVQKRIKRIVICVCIIVLLLGLIPAAALHCFINQHCSYKGVETEKYALQGIYQASDYGLSEQIRMLDTADGETVWVSEIAPQTPKAVVIYLSGIMQPSVTYFYGHAKMMLEDGVASFLLEVRAHGESSGKQLGLGYTEAADVQAVVDYIRSTERYRGVPIILQGVSMGGAIAINAFGQIEAVDGCIAMSPYSSFEAELDLMMQRVHIPKLLRDYELFFMKQALRLNFSKDAVEHLKPEEQILHANGRPVAIIACRWDSSVPVDHAYKLSEEAPFAKLWIRESWEHFIVKGCDFAHVAEDTEYCDFVRQFVGELARENG